MQNLKPTLIKSLVPLGIIILSFIPSFFVRTIIFEVLAYPINFLIQPFRYDDKPYLTPFGAVIVGVIWAVILYLSMSLFGARFRR